MSATTNAITKKAPTTNALSALTEQLGLVNTNELYGIVKQTLMPGNTKDEEVAAFCMVAATYHLNPLAREIFAFPSKQGGIQPMVSIDGWLKLLNANPDYDGMEHDYDPNKQWVECRIYSKSRPNHPTVVREFLEENMVKSSPVWQQRPLRMLRHRATIQAIRYFGGYAGIMDMDEARDNEMRNVTPQAKEATWLGAGSEEPRQKVLEAPAQQAVDGGDTPDEEICCEPRHMAEQRKKREAENDGATAGTPAAAAPAEPTFFGEELG